MSRRGSPSVQILIGITVVALFLYGFYSYHEVKSRLRSMEEKADRLRTQHESVSAQLQVVYEHKTRLEKAVQEEKAQHKKTKEDLTLEKGAFEKKMMQEKDILTQDVERLKAETEKLEDDFNNVEKEKQQLKDELKTSQDNCQKERETSQQQLNQQRQECDNDVAQLKDEIADLRRRNADLETKVQKESHDGKSHIADLSAGGRNKSVQIDEGQNVMQIVQPGDKLKSHYFEVKSPIPEDKNLAKGKELPQAQKHQVVAPVVKDAADVNAREGGDEEDGNGNAVDAAVPNANDNQIKDVQQPADQGLGNNGNIDNNVIKRIPNEEREKNPVPGQAPAPDNKEQNNAIRKSAEQEAPAQEENDEPAQQNPPPGQVRQPGQAEAPGKGKEQGHLPNDDANEDEEAENEQQDENKDQQQNAEQDDYNGKNDAAKEM